MWTFRLHTQFSAEFKKEINNRRNLRQVLAVKQSTSMRDGAKQGPLALVEISRGGLAEQKVKQC